MTRTDSPFGKKIDQEGREKEGRKRPKKRKKREGGGEERIRERQQKEEKGGPAGRENDEEREPGNGPRGPNRKRGKSTGKYVVDSAERRPKAKWNSVR